MPKATSFLLDEVPVSRQRLSDLRASDAAFGRLCDDYESVEGRIDALAGNGDNPAEAARLKSRRDALRQQLVAFIGQATFHH